MKCIVEGHYTDSILGVLCAATVAGVYSLHGSVYIAI